MVPVDFRGMSPPFWKQQAGELPVEDALQLWPIEPAAKVAFCLPEKARLEVFHTTTGFYITLW